MYSVPLQSALTDFLRAASELLSAELGAGAEIPFELDSRPAKGARGPSLYCYRPLTAEFIAQRRGRLEALPEYEAASAQLAAFEGLERYLVSIGEDVARLAPPARVRAAIASLLGEVFADQSDFELHEDRLSDALGKLHSTALSAGAEVTIVARLRGMTIASPELALAPGLTLAHPDALEGLPTELSAAVEGPGDLVVVLACADQDVVGALDGGREVLRDLLRALRLFGDGRVSLGGIAWSRVGEGRWSPLALGGGGRPHGMLLVTAEQEDELRAFCNLVSRRAPDGNELAWALRRFEMGCERADPYEALSDDLLALRALLEPEGPSSGMLAGRLAALCATPERRLALTERTVQAIALERDHIAGLAVARAGSAALAEDVADHLRALLRDVICGHLDPDLVGLADELLLAPPPAAAVEPHQAEAPTPEALGEEPAFEPRFERGVPGTIPFRAARMPAGEDSDAELIGDAGEAEEILDLFI